MQDTVKMTVKGQITLPKEYRDKLGLDQGSLLTIVIKGDALILKKHYPVPPLSDQDPIWDMAGLFDQRTANGGKLTSPRGVTDCKGC